MKRSVIATGAAMVGVAWLLTYKVSPHSAGAVALAPPSPSPTADVGASPSPGASAAPSPSPIRATGTFLGSDFPNRFGDVQVKLVIKDGRITDVQEVQMPSDREQSAYISQVAGPMLRSEVLQAQSAQIDVISGATYTSESYAQSVESALQQAHMG